MCGCELCGRGSQAETWPVERPEVGARRVGLLPSFMREVKPSREGAHHGGFSREGVHFHLFGQESDRVSPKSPGSLLLAKDGWKGAAVWVRRGRGL